MVQKYLCSIKEFELGMLNSIQTGKRLVTTQLHAFYFDVGSGSFHVSFSYKYFHAKCHSYFYNIVIFIQFDYLPSIVSIN